MVVRKYLKFTGKFTDLIPQGFTFWKAYARNYRVYTLRPDGTPRGSRYGQSINVWQHYGGYVDIENLDEVMSAVLVDLITSGKIDTFKKSDRHYRMMVDNINHVIEEYSFEKHRWPFHQMLEAPKTPETERKIRAYYEQWYEFSPNFHLINFLKEMIQRGQIQVCEDNRRRR